jgi:hypothetical protein
VLVTTAPRTQSADVLFSQYKEQNDVELIHYQLKTPLAVRPLFVPEDAPEEEQRRTAESLLREFRGYGLIERRARLAHALPLVPDG